MATTEQIARRLGVSEADVAAVLAESEKVTGYVRCLNAGCEQFDTDREVPFSVESVSQRDDTGRAITTNEYRQPANDEDMTCPECSGPVAVIPEKRRVVPSMGIMS